MPRFYEEAAQLLYMIAPQGVVLAPGADYRRIVCWIAVEIEGFMQDRISHADAAGFLLTQLVAGGQANFHTDKRSRLVAVAGTMIGNLMTVNRRLEQRCC